MPQESKEEMPQAQRELLAEVRDRLDRARIEVDLALTDLTNVKQGPMTVLALVCQLEGVAHAGLLVLDRAGEMAEEAYDDTAPTEAAA